MLVPNIYTDLVLLQAKTISVFHHSVAFTKTTIIFETGEIN